MKKLDFQKIINAEIALNESHYAEYLQVMQIIKTVDKKVIDKRTFSQKVLTDKFTLRAEFGMFHIVGKYTHLIGYNSSPFVNAAKFEEWDCCNGNAAKQRIHQLRNLIEDEKIFSIFNQIDKNFNSLRLLFGEIEKNRFGSFYFPAYYSVLNFIQDVKNDKLELSNFYYIRK